jgi:hypothetical protein
MADTASPLEFYRVVRSRIEHEDNLVTQRLSWLIASQSFFFTAFAVVNGEINSTMKIHLLHLIPVVAAMVAGLIFCSIVAGVIAKSNLRAFYRSQTLGGHGKPAPVASYAEFTLPLIQGRRFTILLGLTPPLGLPPLFIVVWLYLLMTAQ